MPAASKARASCAGTTSAAGAGPVRPASHPDSPSSWRHRAPASGLRLFDKTYGPGKAGAEVALWTIQGGGHPWPGRDPIVKFLGKSTRQISANDLLWEFFQRHPLP